MNAGKSFKFFVIMCNTRLDSRDRFPSGMEDYLSQYGWHFSPKMAKWAVSKMKDRNGRKIEVWSKEMIDDLLGQISLRLENDKGYDAFYVANMAKSDFFGSSLVDERAVACFIKDYIDDEDAYDGMPFTRFFADCIGKGVPIIWEDML